MNTNPNQISDNTQLITATIVTGTKVIVDEVVYQSENHSVEIDKLSFRLDELERKILTQNDLNILELNLSKVLSETIEKRIDKLEDNFKTYIQNNVVMKSDLHNSSKDMIDWVKTECVKKEDISKLEISLLWKLIGLIGLIVGLTAYIMKP